ncbi:MAG: relaxase/mobilization nuclease domain-containing protein [Erysipelotrichaceae bacterium]|nr:relaxase/mobilization nuclease domain-containing protein [Erysipelotrichaceae bacterium]
MAQSLADRTDYAINPDKTQDGKYVSSYECSPETVDTEFLLAKQKYYSITGREPQHGRDIIAYQIRQAFFPGEITAEQANKIGYELAMRFTGGQHQFIVATHIDKAHVHNHIIFNSTTLYCTHKFNNYKDSAEVVREMIDRLCLENDLSIIENPAPKGKHYAEWKAEREGTSWKAKLRETIDNVLPGCTDFDHFLRRMEKVGYEVKRGKYISFRAKGQERFTRAKTLGKEYAEDVLQAKISGTYVPAISVKKPKQVEDRRVAFIIDIQQKIAEGKGVGYEKWAKVFNLKESAKALNYFTEHGLTSMEELEAKAAEASSDFKLISDRLKLSEARMREIKELKTHIINYGETRNTYAAYRNAKRPSEFYEQHREYIEMHLAAKRAFDELGVKKLPSVAHLNAEFSELSAQRKAQYETYKAARTKMLEWGATKSNIEAMLRVTDREMHQERER